jgi:hypothetical protein
MVGLGRKPILARRRLLLTNLPTASKIVVPLACQEPRHLVQASVTCSKAKPRRSKVLRRALSAMATGPV